MRTSSALQKMNALRTASKRIRTDDPAFLHSLTLLQKLKNLFVFFRSQIGADAHVHHGDFPLGVVVTGRRTRVVAALAIIRPKLGAAFRCGASWGGGSGGSSLLIAGAANHNQCQRGEGGTDDSAGQADQVRSKLSKFFHKFRSRLRLVTSRHSDHGSRCSYCRLRKRLSLPRLK